MTTEISVSNFNATFVSQLNANFEAIDAALDAHPQTVAGLADLKALTGLAGSIISQYRATAGDGGGGVWVWRSGNQSSNVSADSKSGLWAAPDSDTTGASGAWQRQTTGERYIAWFDDGAEDGLVFQAAINSITSGQAGTIVVNPGTYTLTSTPTANGRYPFFVVQAGASISGTFTLPYLQQYTNGINFDNGLFRIGSNDALSGTGALMIGGADMRENGNGSYLVNDGHPNWNAIESSIAYNPTEFNIYGNQTGGIASASGTAITRVSGVSFASWMVGRKFFYNGTEYTVDTVTDADNLTLTASAGTSSNKTYHFVYTTGSGTCNVSGSTVTRVTGEPFMPFITSTGFVFKINGTTRTVSAYNSKDSLTLSSAPGDVTGATFTYEVRINDQISTLRIQKLVGTHEENLAIFAKPTGYYFAALNSGSGQKWPVYFCSDETGGSPQPVAELAASGKFIALGGTQTDAAARFNWTSSQVNYFDIYGSTTGITPNLRSRGSDTNVNFGIDTKGTGNVNFTSGSFGGTNFQVFGAAANTSWLGVSGSTADTPDLSASGSSSNIDITITPKGTGRISSARPFRSTYTTAGGFEVSAAAGNFRSFQWSTSGTVRWQAVCNNTAEAGANAGSDWSLNSFSDAGAFIANAIVVTRSTSKVALAGDLTIASGKAYQINGTQVVSARSTGWTAMTGSTDKATAYDTSTVTLAQLAGRVMALQAALTTHGLIGA